MYISFYFYLYSLEVYKFIYTFIYIYIQRESIYNYLYNHTDEASINKLKYLLNNVFSKLLFSSSLCKDIRFNVTYMAVRNKINFLH